MTTRSFRDYFRCPDCGLRRVTRRDFSDGDGYACDRCDFSAYIEEEGDQHLLVALADCNPLQAKDVQFKYRGERTVIDEPTKTGDTT